MGWREYREQREESYQTFDLKDVGLPDFWIKIRKVGTFTQQELATYSQYWLNERIKYLTNRITEQASSNEGEELTPSEQEVSDVVAQLEGGLATDDIPDARRRKIMSYLIEQQGLERLQPLVGMDIECLTSWNLTDPEADGASGPMPLPREDMSVLEKLPLEVLWQIKERMLEATENAAPLKVRKLLSISG